MKSLLLILLTLSFTQYAKSQNNTKNDNLLAFAKAFGYVKYFHPSDEAYNNYWKHFAVYGAKKVEHCKNNQELVETLNELFQPIAPTVRFSLTKEHLAFVPIEQKSGSKPVYWQHKGVSYGMISDNSKQDVYRSVRVNTLKKIDKSSRYGNLTTSIEIDSLRGKEIRFSAWAKAEKDNTGISRFWVGITNGEKVKYFERYNNSPIESSEWKEYKQHGVVEADAKKLFIGALVQGEGTIYVDNIRLEYKGDDGNWIEIPLKNWGFEDEAITTSRDSSSWSLQGTGYQAEAQTKEVYQGKYSAKLAFVGKLSYKKEKKIFDFAPKPNELIDEEIIPGVRCMIPLMLYSKDRHTYPKANADELKKLRSNLRKMPTSPDDLYVRLGNIIIVYNVFQHFYPYMDVMKVDWESQFLQAINQSYNDKDGKDHQITLEKFTASLKDGHVSVRSRFTGYYLPGISWERINDTLIITEVIDSSLTLKRGDIVTSINGQSAENYFTEIDSRISAATKGWLNYRANTVSLLGAKDSSIQISVNGKTYKLERKYPYRDYFNHLSVKSAFERINDRVFYLNLDEIKMTTIDSLLPDLKKCTAIICDLRGYPNGNHKFISYLLKKNDHDNNWMQIPELIYPNYRVSDFDDNGWNLKAKKPYLGDKKIIFITDGSAISYAESYMGFIEGYHLATIIGQPTAGTNGNINPFQLFGGYTISWTGMKVIKHDGSQQHGIGILPDIYVQKTIKGVREGRDEFLEKAIELAE